MQYRICLILVTFLALACTSTQLFFDPTQLSNAILSSVNVSDPSEAALAALVDGNGERTTNISDARGITFDACMANTRVNIDWNFITWDQFVPMFGTWLLPWLALTAQLPYETQGSRTNLMSLFLALGSPFLAAYSLSLTVLTANWANRAFRRELDAWQDSFPEDPPPRERPEAIQAARVILIETQHVPIRLSRFPHLDLAQVVARPENSEWWISLAREILKTKRERTLSLYVQLGWVLTAQALVIVQFFSTGANDSSVVVGLATNTLWAWILPIVWGWVYVGTQRSARSIREAVEAATAPHVEDANGNLRRRCRALADRSGDETPTFLGFSIPGWEQEPGPMFVYARVWSHLGACELVRRAWKSHREWLQVGKNRRRPDQSAVQAVDAAISLNAPTGELEMSLLAGTSAYSFEEQPDLLVHSGTPSSVGVMFFVAGLAGFVLQWGTTGSAIMMAYMTPVVGLGCVSGAYLLYGAAATFIWFLLVFSAWLSHKYQVAREQNGYLRSTWLSYGSLAAMTRLMGNTLAVVNSIWVVMFSFFQFTNLYNNCWCAATSWQDGENSWVLLFKTDGVEWSVANQYWSSGTFLGLMFAFLTGVFFVVAKGDDLFRTQA